MVERTAHDNLAPGGATPAGGEAMTGRIFRVAVYSGIVPDADLKPHADAFKPATSTPGAPSLALAVSGTQSSITLLGEAGIHYRLEYADSLPAGTWQLLQDIPKPDRHQHRYC